MEHWFLLDAWYRSRCLELPRSGESMVPCLDMVNHSSVPNAYFEENAKDEVVLLLRPKCEVSAGDEITINYGDQKSPDGMLFSYGFIEVESTKESLALPLEPFPDDPLAKAKLHVFGTSPTVKLERVDESIRWNSPFAYLMCVNEEDGLGFRVLQETNGDRQLRAFWQDTDVTASATAFESLTETHELSKIIQLRVVSVVQNLVESHLQRMQSGTAAELSLRSGADMIRDGCVAQAHLLRSAETNILAQALAGLEAQVCSFIIIPCANFKAEVRGKNVAELHCGRIGVAAGFAHAVADGRAVQKSLLFADESVSAYLGSAEVVENDLAEDEASNEEDDFS